MTTAALLVAALILDAVFGEPRWLWSRPPHPAVLMGRLIAIADKHLNQGNHRRAKGIALTVALVALGALLGLALTRLGPIAEILIAAILLAQRSLIDHVMEVARALRRSLPEGRKAVSMIVGRDPEQLDQPAVARAAIESAAENFSDGVIAPAFWFLVAGLPGILIYKLINTADSMIGHRSPRYEHFGWAAARLDDVLNYVPARLTALLMAPKHIAQIWREGPLHRSVNAGFPEAAMATRLGLALSGPRSYDGEETTDPILNPDGTRNATPADITAACRVLWQVWALALGTTAVLAIL